MELTLELEDLSEIRIPGAHRHPPRPVAPSRGFDALATRSPGIEEGVRIRRATQDGQWHAADGRCLRGQAPRVEREPAPRDEAPDDVPFVLEVRGRDERPHVALIERNGFRGRE